MKKIYVGNLAYSVNEEELEGLFNSYGEIVNVNLIRDRNTGRSKGFGFVEFSTPDQAQEALKMDGQPFQERPLKVSLAREQQQRRAGGGGGGGGGGGMGDRRSGNGGGGGRAGRRW